MIRASRVVNRQLTLAFLLFRDPCHAWTSLRTTLMSSILLFRHCPPSTLNSISATFSQLPCFGVYTKSKRSYSALALSGANASYSDPGTWVLRLSMTSVIFSALSY